MPSLLDPDDAVVGEETPADVLADLGLDRVVDALTAGRAHHDLGPLYRTPAAGADVVDHRHAVVRDLGRPTLRAPLDAFAAAMGGLRAQRERAARSRHRIQADLRRLEALRLAGELTDALAEGLAGSEPESSGLRALRDHAVSTAASEEHRGRVAATSRCRDAVRAVCFTLSLGGNRASVRRFEGAEDHAAAVEATFARFRSPGGGGGGRVELRPGSRVVAADPDLDHVQAGILELVQERFPEPFAELAAHLERHADATDPVLERFDRELAFYLAYLELLRPLQDAGLATCLPARAVDEEPEHADACRDLSLAVATGSPPVPNDWRLAGAERFLVVTGPNNGGKTTFARAFGQLHHLASLGLPVPAARARLAWRDRVVTHFARAEDPRTDEGALEDELRRMRAILDVADGRTAVVMNESFGTTSLADAREIGTEVLERLVAAGARGVCVTFVDELSRLGDATVSLVAGVDPGDPTRRTYEIDRRPADGLAFATALARAHGLSHDALADRLAATR